MSDREKLQALHTRLTEEQRRIIQAAADQDVLPPVGALLRIAQVEQTILAVEAMLGEPEAFRLVDASP